uniref:uncharacterized protein LOC117604275 n=1 Tax=Osmia lignaria TaxID=473952 RepID=UPI0014798296|nr:uncharacterized protein LOC117604275 [Osmia lignaria]
MSSSHYCVWGLCGLQGYCCGDNVCCEETNINALLIGAIVFGAIAIMSLCCAYLYCNSRRIYGVFLKRYFKINYNLMSIPQENLTVSVTNQKSTKTENYVVQM